MKTEITVDDLVELAKAKAQEADGMISQEVIRSLVDKSVPVARAQELTRLVCAALEADDIPIVPQWRYKEYQEQQTETPFNPKAEARKLEELEKEVGDAFGNSPPRLIPYYIARLLRHEFLSRERERELVIAAQAGDLSARDMLLAFNARLIAKWVYAYCRRTTHLRFEDLFQEGAMGFLHAIPKFDAARGVKLATYASWHIRKVIRRAIENQSRAVRVPVETLEFARQVARAQSELRRETGEAATPEQVAQRLERKVKRVLIADEATRRREVSLSAPVREHDDDQRAFEAFLDAPAHQQDRFEFSAQLVESHEFLQLIADMPPYEREVILLRVSGWTLKEVGARFGMTREAARLREVNARARMSLRRVFSHTVPARAELEYLGRVLSVTRATKKDARVFDWAQFRPWVAVLEGAMTPEETALLVQQEYLRPESASCVDLFWAGASQEDFASPSPHWLKTLRGRMQMVWRSAWLTSQLRLGKKPSAVVFADVVRASKRVRVQQVTTAHSHAPSYLSLVSGGAGSVEAVAGASGSTVLPVAIRWLQKELAMLREGKGQLDRSVEQLQAICDALTLAQTAGEDATVVLREALAHAGDVHSRLIKFLKQGGS